MKFRLLLILLIVSTVLIAQQSNTGAIFEKIQDAKLRTKPNTFEIVNISKENIKSYSTLFEEITEGLILDLNYREINSLQGENSGYIQMNFPLPDQSIITIDLIENKVLTTDFIFTKSSDPENVSTYNKGKYYHGVISNDPHSLVSISVFENEIIGIISSSSGNYNIGKLRGIKGNKHIIYNDLDLVSPFSLDCGTENDGRVYGIEEITLNESSSRDAGDCISVYIEIDDDIVTDKGGVTGATNYITGLFNEVITLYANDGIVMVVSEILAWDTPAPYSGASSSDMLSSYQANTGTFNGDLSHLVSYQASGGIAAGFAGICAYDPDNSKCFSSIDANYSSVPAYSFSVMVCTHEMGHLIGSRHTHACVWNGDGTAIDGCAGYIEGYCPIPGSPAGGGTIMSYCHLTTGIDFTQGFGLQPQAVLINTLANANCLSPCGGPAPTCSDGIFNGNETGVDCGGPDCDPCPTCDDGIQNGDETGVDCGGSFCDPCSCSDGIQNGDETGVDCGGPDCDPCPCFVNEINISITFDDYPEETSWDIRDLNNVVVSSGGTYGSEPDGTTLIIDVCLNDGCYDFTIYDSFGDGICCAYGAGSYTVTSQFGEILATGSAFGSLETTNICVFNQLTFEGPGTIWSNPANWDKGVVPPVDFDGTIIINADCIITADTVNLISPYIINPNVTFTVQ